MVCMEVRESKRKKKKKKKRWDFNSTRFESKDPRIAIEKRLKEPDPLFCERYHESIIIMGEESKILPVVGREWQDELHSSAINMSRPTEFHAAEYEHETTETDYSHRPPTSAAQTNRHAVHAVASP